tara:strand:- start:319 stop:555 length:237 start_codon:yes stop_codon:yes gene_type:complete
MKTFEIEVVRSYTTTIEVNLPDTYTPSDVERITIGDSLGKLDGLYTENEAYYEIWDKLGEAELEQCDTDMQSVKVKKL